MRDSNSGAASGADTGGGDFDPYRIDDSGVEEPPTGFWATFRQTGPGLILAASIVGTGELINATILGARAGFTLLWLILLSCVIKVFLQVELGRHAIVHGETTLAAFNTLGGPRLGRANWICWLWLVMMILTLAQVGTMIGLIGQSAAMAFPKFDPLPFGRPELPWAGLTVGLAVALLWSGGYKRLERITTALVATVTLLTIVWVLGLQFTDSAITARDVAEGFSFTMPAAALTLAFSAFGITGVGASELFAYPYWCIEKGYARAAGARSESPEWARRARGWFRVLQFDAWFSMVVFTVATLAFYLLGAAVLSRREDFDPNAVSATELLEMLATMYAGPLRENGLERFAPATVVLFLIGACAVLFKTLYVATAGNARMTTDLLDLAGVAPVDSRAKRDGMVRLFSLALPLVAFGFFILLPKPILLVAIGGTAQALMLPIIAGATLMLRFGRSDSRLAPNVAADGLTLIAALSVSVFAIYQLWTFALELMAKGG